MRRLILFLVVACAVGVPTGSVASAKNDLGVTCVLHAKLAAKNETTGSTSTAKGHTQIKVRNDGTIEFKTHILNPVNETFVAGHIHVAPAGVAGPVVQSLFVGGPTSDRQIMQSGSVSNPELGAAICANPSGYYVNYHSTTFPAGAIRGQLA